MCGRTVFTVPSLSPLIIIIIIITEWRHHRCCCCDEEIPITPVPVRSSTVSTMSQSTTLSHVRYHQRRLTYLSTSVATSVAYICRKISWVRINQVKPSNCFKRLWKKLVLPSIVDTIVSSLMLWNLESYPTTVSNEWHLGGGGLKYTLTLLYIFKGQHPQDLRRRCTWSTCLTCITQFVIPPAAETTVIISVIVQCTESGTGQYHQ